MNTLIHESLAKSVSFDEVNMMIALTDGRKLSVPLVFFPRLLNATSKQRKNYIISGGGVGLHWEKLDEDISVKNLLLGIADRTEKEYYGILSRVPDVEPKEYDKL